MAEPAAGASRARRWAFAAALVAVAAAGVGFRQIGDWDSWWQLLIGRVALASFSRLPVDEFSYSVAGAAWAHKDLAGYVVLEGAHAAGGFAGLSVLRSALALLSATFLLLCVPRAQRSPAVWVVCAALMLGANEFRYVPRALVFSEVAFLGLLALIERVRERVAAAPREIPWRLLAATVATMVVWTNLHRGALLGFVVLGGLVGAMTVESVWGAVRGRRTGGRAGTEAGPYTIGAVAATWGVALAGGCLNASGVAVYTTGLAVSYDPIHRGFISEWHPVTLELALRDFWPITALLVAGWVAGLGALAAGWLRSRRVDGERRDLPVNIWQIGVLAVMTFQGLSSLRWLTFASAAAAVVLIRVGSAAASRLHARGNAPIRPLLALALAGAVALPLPLLRNGRAWGAGPVPDRYPDGALTFADEHALGTNVHNAFVFGGYVAWAQWPARRVLIDGRNDMVYPSEFYLRCIEAQNDPAKFAALQSEFPTDWVLAENTAGRETFTFLEQDPAWMAVYWSEPAIVWVRREAHAGLAPLEYRVLDTRNPVASMMGAMAQAAPGSQLDLALRAELQRFAEASPNSVRANALLVLYFDARGDRARRDLAMEHLETVAPGSEVVEQLRAGLTR